MSVFTTFLYVFATTTLQYAAWGVLQGCTVLAIVALINAVFRWSHLERAYVGILRFAFKQCELSTIKSLKDDHHAPVRRLSSLSTMLDTKPHDCPPNEGVYDEMDCQTTQNGKTNSIRKRHKTSVFDETVNLVSLGLKAVVDDEFTSRFSRQRLTTWNMMSRTKEKQPIPWWAGMVWALGLVIRYGLLFPLRILSFIALYLGSCVVVILGSSLLPQDSYLRPAVYRGLVPLFFGQFSGCIFTPTFHNCQYRPKRGLTVANHTSPFDVFVFFNDAVYSLTGQQHKGYIGLLQKLLHQLAPQIWFERTSATDRNAMREMLIEHIREPDNPPIIIFPEGTCSNNTATMMFKKGSFECHDVVHPVAVKYDPMFCDFLWDSVRQSAPRYLLHVFTSWQVVCDVWYLPPMTRLDNESAEDFTRRVKRAISEKAGLDELAWDGNLKRFALKQEDKERAKRSFSRRFS